MAFDVFVECEFVVTLFICVSAEDFFVDGCEEVEAVACRTKEDLFFL